MRAGSFVSSPLSVRQMDEQGRVVLPRVEERSSFPRRHVCHFPQRHLREALFPAPYEAPCEGHGRQEKRSRAGGQEREKATTARHHVIQTIKGELLVIKPRLTGTARSFPSCASDTTLHLLTQYLPVLCVYRNLF